MNAQSQTHRQMRSRLIRKIKKPLQSLSLPAVVPKLAELLFPLVINRIAQMAVNDRRNCSRCTRSAGFNTIGQSRISTCDGLEPIRAGAFPLAIEMATSDSGHGYIWRCE
jgi:hypothetical protein